MAQLIQFPCPACNITLSVPLQAASQRGPCPHCGQFLIAPDPFRGTPAQLLRQNAPTTPEPPMVRLRPFQRTTESTAFRPQPVTANYPDPPKPAPETITSGAPQTAQPALTSPAKSVWPTALGIGILAAILGFAGGYQSAQSAHQPLIAKPEAMVVKTVIPPSLTGNVLSAPKSALKSFLAAPDWKSRSSFVLFPDRVTKRMEAYYAKHPDSPTTANRLAVEHCESDPSSELLLVVIRVTTADCPTGFTVAVEETPDGWKVDWDSFIEFKDMLFDRFTAGKDGDTGRFHLVAQPAAKSPERENAISYTLTDPVKGTEHSGYVIRGSEAAATLARLTADGSLATPVLALELHRESDGSATLEIRSVIATNWRPQRGD